MNSKYKFEFEVIAVDLEVLDFEYLKFSIVTSIRDTDADVEVTEIKLLFDTNQLGDNSVLKVNGECTLINQDDSLNHKLYLRRVINSSIKVLFSNILNVAVYKISNLNINSI